MKKIYIAPQTEVHVLSLNSMVCTSLEYGGNASVNSITSADSRRHHTVWDDDDDYEY